MSSFQRITRLLELLCAVAVTGGVLGWAAGSPMAIYRGVRSAGQDFDGLVTSASGLLAWLGLGWFGATLVLEAATALPGWWGRACDSVAERVTPQVVRKLAQALIGVTVLAGPLAGGSAMAAERPLHAATSVVAPSPASSPSASPSPSTSASQPSTLVDLDRPDASTAQAFVPTAPPAAVRQAPSGPAALLAGTVHRDNAIGAYVVHRGDALWDIAARHLGPQATAADVAREWPRWYAANREVIGPDPGVIRPGESLRPPA